MVHVERVPVSTKMAKFFPPDAWNVCSLQPFIHALHTVLEPEGKRPIIPPGPNPPTIATIQIEKGDCLDQNLYSETTWKQISLDRKDSVCFPGNLSDIGKIHMMRKGQELRSLYVDKLKFIPPHLTHDFIQNCLYVRSTGYLRTIESVQYLLGGLFPLEKREPGPQSDITIHIRAEENSFPEVRHCPRLKDLLDDFVEAARKKSEPLLTSLTYRLTSRFPRSEITSKRKSDQSGATVTDSGPSDDQNLSLTEISTILDALLCAQGAGLELPNGVNKTTLDDLKQASLELFWDAFQEGGEEIKKLAIGRFLGDLKDFMGEAVKAKKDYHHLGIFSAHDTTVGPVLGALNVFKDDVRAWPPFGLMLTLELFEDKEKKYYLRGSDHYVRLRNNGVPVAIPACSKKGTNYLGDPTLCTFDAFVSSFKTLIPKDFHKECISKKSPVAQKK
ncbi:hypothetical protein HDU76_002513 [Blyttiomyces sp. JEL0837]|nr:hypothetical protein HDU76_002513 [Blyttiomyces sp. JEL0837]